MRLQAQEISRHRQAGEDRHEAAPVVRAVGHHPQRRIGGDPDPLAHRQERPDLAGAEPARGEPHRPIRELHAGREEEPGIEQRKAEGGAHAPDTDESGAKRNSKF